MDEDQRDGRRRRLEDAASRHPDVPQDIAEAQIDKLDEGLELLGADRELEDAAEIALEKNLKSVEDARTTGAHVTEDPQHPDD